MATESNKGIFLDGFRTLFKEQWQADVRLKAGKSHESAPIPVHKLVLAARSKVFKKIFASDERKNSANIAMVILCEMKHEELEALVEFMYSPDGSISSESLKKHGRSLYVAADKHEIPHLRDICRAYLISSLDSWNALNILELAQIPFDKVLSRAAFTTIKNNISAIASSAEFKLFVANHPDLAVEVIKDSLPNKTRSCGYCGSYCGRC